jgi:hypothetical protein
MRDWFTSNVASLGWLSGHDLESPIKGLAHLLWLKKRPSPDFVVGNKSFGLPLSESPQSRSGAGIREKDLQAAFRTNEHLFAFHGTNDGTG